MLENGKPETFFEECKKGAWKARGILIDSDTSAIDNIRATKDASAMYGVDNFCHGNFSLGSIFAKGRYGEGDELAQKAMDKLRKQMESCESLQGLMVYHALGGGASGLANSFLSHCYDICAAPWKMTCLLYPNAKAKGSVLDPYNTVLCHDSVIYNS